MIPAVLDAPKRDPLIFGTATLCAAVGFIALMGWVFSVGSLKSLLPGAVEMKANTALGLLTSSIALLLIYRGKNPLAVRVLGAIVGLLGAATLVEYGWSISLGIDELLFKDTAQAFNTIRGRMAPYSAASFCALGIATLLHGVPSLRYASRAASSFAILVGVVSLLGYMWNASEIVTESWLPPVAFNTAIAFVALGSGLLAATRVEDDRRDRALARFATVEIKMLLGLLVALVLLLLGGGYTYRAAEAFADSAQWVTHTQEVRATLSELAASMSGAEAAENDYFLTGDASHRDEYHTLVGRVISGLQGLGMLVSDNPDQRENFAALAAQLAARMEELGERDAAYSARGLPGVAALMAARERDRPHATFSVLLSRMDAEELRLLQKRSAASERVRQITLVSLLVTIGIAITIFLFLFRAARQEMIGRGLAEEALRASEEYNRSIVDSSPDCLSLLTLDGRITAMTQKGRQLWGVAADATLADTDWMAFWKDGDEAAARDAIQAARGGATARFVGYAPSGMGQPSWWDVVITPIAGQAGTPHSLLAVARNISEVKRVEGELVKANRFLDFLIEHIPSMVFLKDARDLTFARVNRAGQRLLGRPGEQVVGKRAADFLSTKEALAAEESDRAALASPEVVQTGELILESPTLGTRTLQTMKTALTDAEDQPQFVLGLATDITERKAAEEAIRALNRELEDRAAALQASYRELESFSYSVSHDLRAPLRAIDGFSLMLEEDCKEVLSPEAQRFLATIRKNSQRMGELIDDLLAFSRLGRQPIAKGAVNMEDLVREVVEEALASTPERRARVAIGHLPHGTADRALLRQVWVNLVSNALKYGAKAEDLRIEISGTNGGAECVYSIRDNGAGFDMAYYDKLFGVFQRLHRIDEFEGTGVGLAIVQRIVARHGGRIWAEGKVNQGASFTFSLPLGGADA